VHFVGLNPEAHVSPDALIAAARSFLGSPFLHQGRTRLGVDCIGLVIASLTKVGVVYYEEPPTYARLPNGDSLLGPLKNYCQAADDPEPGTVLAMRFRRQVTHVALCTGPTIIHAYEGARRVIEHTYDRRWRSLTVCQWRLPGIVYAGSVSE
jgi:cell wall-associated NlpC family hydrolase